jgi:hypothetical protein
MSGITRRAALSLVAATMALGMGTKARGDLDFNYSFGTAAAGTFTTGAASPTDPGYFLVTSLTVTQFTDSMLGAIQVSVRASQFEKDAAYDPTTGAFINHASNSTFQDVGNIFEPSGTIDGAGVFEVAGGSFSTGNTTLLIEDLSSNDYEANGKLTITAATSAVPELSTGVMTALGAVVMIGYGWSRGRRVCAK